MKDTLCIVALCASVGLTACGGGSGSPAPPTSDGGGSQPPAAGVAHFTIGDTLSYTVATARRPASFSSAIALMRVTIAGQPTVQIALSSTSSACTVSGTQIACAADVPVANGAITYSIEMDDQYSNALSTATGSATISGATTIPLTLSGIWKFGVVRLGNESPAFGAPVSIPVTVSGYDDDDALIVGPQPYTSPLPLYDSDTSGATRLSVPSVAAPGQAVTLTYNGVAFVAATISAGSAPQVTGGGQDTMVPALSTVEYAIPSGTRTGMNSGEGALFANTDGSITFAEQGAIGHVTAAGVVTETNVGYFSSMVRGPDGNVWVIAHSCYPNCTGADNNALERFDAVGNGTKLPMFANYSTGPIVVGSDNNFWVPATDANNHPVVERVTPAGIETDFPVNISGIEQLSRGVLGADGAVWLLGTNVQNVVMFVRVDTSGNVTSFPVPSSDVNCCSDWVVNMALGPDGQIYAPMNEQLLGRITTAGVYSDLAVGTIGYTNLGPFASNALAFGPDGALWISVPGVPLVTASCDPGLERVTTTGAYATMDVPAACDPILGAAQINGFANGADGNLWYTRGTFVGKVELH